MHATQRCFRRQKVAVAYFLLAQCTVALCVSVIARLYFSHDVFVSSALGGLLAIIPNIFLATYLLTFRKPSIYLGELLKILLIAGLFITLLHFFQVQLLAFLVGFGAAYAVYFAAQLIMIRC